MVLVTTTLSLAMLIVLALTALFNLPTKLILLIEEVKGEESATSMSVNTGVFMANLGNSILNCIGGMINTGISGFTRASIDIQRRPGENEITTWIFCGFVSITVLYIIVRKDKYTLRKYASPSTVPVVATASPVDHASPTTEKRLVKTSTSEFVPESEYGGRVMYEKISNIVTEAYYLSKHNNLLKPKMITSPMLKDVLDVVEPLQKYIQEGVLNLNLMSQEYMKQNAELLRAEDNIKSMCKYKDVIENEAELSQCLSTKDKKIARLQKMVNKLRAGVNHFSNDNKYVTMEFNTIVSQLENERNVHNDMLELFQKSMEEEHEVQKFIDDELEVQIRLKKACEEEYSRNLNYIVKMLLTAANAENKNLDSIKDFVASDFFTNFLATKDFSENLSASALLKELHHLAISYSDHLNSPNSPT